MQNQSIEFTELAEHHATLKHVDIDSQCAVTGVRLHLMSMTSAS